MKADRAVKRYLQIQAIEVTVEAVEGSIDEVQKEIEEAEERLGELRKQKTELMKQMREAARDEGQLPLFADVEAALARGPVMGEAHV